MTVAEFLRWETFDLIMPIGFIDLHFGRLMHLIASIMTEKGHTPAFENFIMGEWPKKAPDFDDLENKLDQLAAIYGGLNE